MCRAAEASAQPDAAKFSYAAKAKQKPGQKPFSASPAMPMSNSESRHQAAESEPASPQKPIPDHITVAAQHGPAAHVPWPMPGAVPQSPSGNETWEVSTAQSTLPPHQRAASRTSMHQVHSTDYLLSESWSCKMTLSGMVLHNRDFLHCRHPDEYNAILLEEDCYWHSPQTITGLLTEHLRDFIRMPNGLN